MQTLQSISFWFNFVYFLFASFIAFYIPGTVLLKKYNLTFFQETVLAIALGMNLWAFQGVIFGYTHLRFLSYIYLLIFIIIWVKNRLYLRFKPIKIGSVNKVFLAIFIFGVASQWIATGFMDLQFANGLRLCCGHPPDNHLELSIVNEVIHRFPPNEPGMYGIPLQNYHYWGHIVMGETIRVFHLPLIATVYQYFVFILSILFGLLIIVFAQLLSLKKSFAYWCLFFSYFGGDAIYLLSLFLGKGFNFAVGSMENGGQLFWNYPRAFSIIMLFLGINLFVLWLKKRRPLVGLLMALVFGSLIGFKVYTGFFILAGFVTLIPFWLYKKDFKSLFFTILICLISIAVYLPVNASAGGLFYTGFWRANDFIVLPQLGLSHLELAREIYHSHQNYLHEYLYEVIFLLLFIVCTFGTKIIGVLQTKKSLKKFPIELHIFLISGILISSIIGLFFWQKTGGSNTFNFLVNVLIIISLYTALSLATFIEDRKPKLQYFVIILIVLLTIPRVIQFNVRNISILIFSAGVITNKQLESFDYLKTKTPPDSLILVDPNTQVDYEDPVLPYLADRPSFFSGKVGELMEHGIPYSGREKILQTILTSPDTNKVKNLLQANHINYLYLASSTKLGANLNLPIVFNNGIVKIVKVLH